MKNLFLATAIVFGMSFYANAQDAPKKESMKEHVCTASCKSGTHMYAHGEKGHTCTTACKTASSTKMAMKDHVCTASCKDGKHMYAHGEKGHTCTAACKTM